MRRIKPNELKHGDLPVWIKFKDGNKIKKGYVADTFFGGDFCVYVFYPPFCNWNNHTEVRVKREQIIQITRSKYSESRGEKG